MARFNKILVVKPSSLGDVVHSLALLNTLKNCYPESSIHWVISRNLTGILEDHPMIDTLWAVDKDSWKKIPKISKTVRDVRELAKNLRGENYDLVIDLQGLFRSGLIARFTKAPVILGFSEAREGSRFFYTHRIKGGTDIHAVDRYLKIGRFLGCRTSEVNFPLPVYSNSDTIHEKYSLPDRYAVLVPGARWDTKKWPAERFAKVASGLTVQSIILGGRDDRDISLGIAERAGGKAVSLAGRTSLKELITIIKHAQFMLTNDTGPMHIAAALSVPVYAIFGPTSDIRTGPYGTIHRVFRTALDCSPCFKKSCDHITCMDEISAELVLNSIRQNMG